MGFFEEFGNLIKKYNLEIHTIQIEENLRIMNERLHLALKNEDLPPPVVLFRTTEGDFIPTVFGPIITKSGEKNIKFMNVANNDIVDLYPELAAKEETPTQEPVKEEVASEGTAPIMEEVVEEAPIPEEKIVKKDPHDIENKFYIIGPMLGTEKCNENVFNTFVDSKAAKLRYYNTSNNFIQTFIGPETYVNGNLDLTTKEGKDVIKKLKKSIDEYDVIITLDGWKKAKDAKKLVDYAIKQGKAVIDGKDF